jgi:quinol monooxygenase YgiN
LVYVIVHEKAKDHAKWLKVFNGDAPNRKESLGGAIHQFEGDPNSHYIVFEWSEKEAHDFANFAKTPDMQKVLKEAGVLEQTLQICSPSIKFNK